MTDTPPEEKILTTVQKLLDKAWSTTFEEEKKSLLAKADALMMKYSIDQFKLLDPNRPNTAAPIKGQNPELRMFTVIQSFSDQDTEVYNAMFSLFRAVAEHLGCRTTYRGTDWSGMNVVGYPADLDFLEMMFLTLKLDFLHRVDPQLEPTITWEANLLALKGAGVKWKDIHKILRDHPNYPHRDVEFNHPIGVKFTGVYKKWRDAHPDEPANVGSPKMWRIDFCLGYCRGMERRLREMRQDTVKANDNLPALIKDKISAVDAEFLKLFPPQQVHYDAGGKVIRYSKPKLRAVSYAAQQAGDQAAQRADLSQRNSRVGGAARGEI